MVDLEDGPDKEDEEVPADTWENARASVFCDLD